MYNIGLTKHRFGDPAEAIPYFEKVLASHPNDKEPGANLMEVYRNYSYYSAVGISECYQQMGNYREALHYARLAKNRYPYQSWCGTCIQQANWHLDKRIAYLSARVSAPYAVTVLFVSGMVELRRRNKRKMTIS